MRMYVRLWIASLVALVVDVLYFFYFVFNLGVGRFFTVMGIAAVFSVLFAVSNSRLKYPEGYTLIQAGFFYRRCAKHGMDTVKKYYQNPELAQTLAKEYEFTKGLDNKQLAVMFNIGYEFAAKNIIR